MIVFTYLQNNAVIHTVNHYHIKIDAKLNSVIYTNSGRAKCFPGNFVVTTAIGGRYF